MTAFATINDVSTLWRPLKAGEEERATALLVIVSDSLRVEAQKVGKDLDQLIEESSIYGSVVRSVVVDVVARTLMT